MATGPLFAQVTAIAHVELRAPKGKESSPPEVSAVLWLQPLAPRWHGTAAATGPLTLAQRDRMFLPHVLVVPLGAKVRFPNRDPFFHNVFSLYDGKRFDLGLYESGTNREVVFNREGVSYIFCNIHPEMSAVVLALSTPWWAKADASGTLHISGVPPGSYEAHLWVESADADQLRRWTHQVTLATGTEDLGTLAVTLKRTEGHTNKFGKPYVIDPSPY